MRGPGDLSVQVAEALSPDGVWQLWNYSLGLFLPSNICFVEEYEYIACPGLWANLYSSQYPLLPADQFLLLCSQPWQEAALGKMPWSVGGVSALS